MNKKLISIEFHKNKDKGGAEFTGSVSLQDFMENGTKKNTLSSQTKKAAANYERFINECKIIIGRIKGGDSINQASLKVMWSFGDTIHSFINALRQHGFCLNGLYEHLMRDLHVSRDLLEKVVIFRSYFSDRSLIPNNMVWREIRHAVRSNAEKLEKTLLHKKTEKK